ncbi:hypothetical protein [Yersinia enterocolitica]|uniref:hypothetical protein n=1 Tax=Yersinia enterocolitica TaxID=630 RepID=UPI00065A8BF8|nr:hypothetical protein [Yersinia enterocolitica]CRY23523.1 Uncharacterised protein [Yersinia enterocolitica]
MSINSTGKGSGLIKSAKLPDKDALIKQENKLGTSIKKVQHTIATIMHEIDTAQRENNSNNSLLASLKGIASKHGDDANIRLKNDHFKLGQGSNFLKNLINGGRYKLEQQAAASKLEVKGSVVSAGIGMSALSQLIDNKTESVASSQSKLTDNQTELNKLTKKKADIGKQIDTIEIAEKEKAANKKFLNDFAMIYQTSSGSDVMNAYARFLSGRNKIEPNLLSGRAVITEYEDVHGTEIFYKGNNHLKAKISSLCGSNLSGLVKKSTEVLYTPSDTTTKSYRAQGMTSDGMKTLISQFNESVGKEEKPVYRAGQFLSTTRDVNKTDKFFKYQIKDNIKVMFEIEGNSGSGILVSNGLAFAEGERELFYSPLANFTVTAITKNLNNIRGDYTIKLEEAVRNDKSAFMPY